MEARRSRLVSCLMAIGLIEAAAIAALCLLLARQGRRDAARTAQDQRGQTEAKRRIADLQGQLGKLQARPRPNAEKAGAHVTIYGSGSDYAANFLRRQASPEIAPLRMKVARVSLESSNAALFRFLRLPPEKVASLCNLLVEEQEEQLDVRAEAAGEHITDRAAVDQLAAQDRQELEAKIKDALGEDSYSQLQYFRQTNIERNQVQRLQQTLSYGPAPLSEAQGEQLVKLLADARPPPAVPPSQLVGSVAIVNGQTLVNGRVIGSAPSLTDDVLRQAASFLSSGQIEALQEMQQSQLASQQMREFMSRPQNPLP